FETILLVERHEARCGYVCIQMYDVSAVKIKHQRASGLLQPLEIPMWKWDEIFMHFVTGLPTTQKRHDAIWVVVDRLTKSAHFLPIQKNYSISERLIEGPKLIEITNEKVAVAKEKLKEARSRQKSYAD
nr:putative reverse transcriptase domain-containing protein [Tanacetum cinerariifolium]